MASIQFNDGTARTLTNSVATPGNRFRGWSARPIVRGPVQFALAAGTRYVEEFRTDWKVSLSIENLRPSEMDVAQWLVLHLQRNATTCTLNTADIATRVYTAFLGEGDECSISGPNDEYKYTFSATLTISAPATPPLCVYAA